MKRLFKTILTGLIIVALVLAFAAPPATAAYNVKKVWARVSATAGETLATGDVVCIKDDDGYAYEADANDSDLRPAIGIVGKGGASSATVEIIVVGKLSGWSSLSEGTAGYLSETASAVTQSAPSWNQQVGVAISTTEYFFNFSSYLDASSVTSIGTLSGATPIILEGATADAYETTIVPTDPTADRTVTLPDASGVPVLSSAIPGAAKSISGGDNSIVAEGATADDYETTIAFTDPTADTTVTIADGATGAVMVSSLTTNAPDAANSVTGASAALVFEGTTADAHETSVTATDPTADRTVTLADGGGTVMLSSLATNATDAANSVTGASNALVFEGAAADAHETSVTVTDPTADRTVTLPDRTGQVQIASAASVVTAAASATLTVGLSNVYTLTPTDNEDSTITFSGAGTAGDEITLIVTCTGAADEILTFHATLVSSTGTLTADTTAARFYVIRFISNGTHWYEVTRTAVQT